MYPDIHPAEIYPFSNIEDAEQVKRVRLPLFTETIAAGFPSPADDYTETALDLNELCVRHPSSTFFVRVRGYSMSGAGIQPGDLLVVDRAIVAYDKAIIVAVVNQEFTLKQFHKDKDKKIFLYPANPDFQPIEITEGMTFEVWGVVVSVIHFFGGSVGRHLFKPVKSAQVNTQVKR